MGNETVYLQTFFKMYFFLHFVEETTSYRHEITFLGGLCVLSVYFTIALFLQSY